MHSDLLTAQAILEFYSFTQQLLAIWPLSTYNLSNSIITYYIALGRLLRLWNKFQILGMYQIDTCLRRVHVIFFAMTIPTHFLNFVTLAYLRNGTEKS